MTTSCACPTTRTSTTSSSSCGPGRSCISSASARACAWPRRRWTRRISTSSTRPSINRRGKRTGCIAAKVAGRKNARPSNRFQRQCIRSARLCQPVFPDVLPKSEKFAGPGRNPGPASVRMEETATAGATFPLHAGVSEGR